MTTDYNNFAKTFSSSRKNMKWEELEYFFSQLGEWNILDIWCGSGRLLEQYNLYFKKILEKYLWVDMSQWLIDEAKKTFPNQEFWTWNMLNIQEIVWEKKYKNIFLVASFHHLESLEQREDMMMQLYKICEEWWTIYMTNWALESPLNLEKYKKSKILESENDFWSSDFSIKIWKFQRFYHSFNILELEYLAKNSGFNIIENRLFDNGRNITTILQK